MSKAADKSRRTKNDPLPLPTVVTISLYTRIKAVSHDIHTAHIFIVCNSLPCTKSFNIISILYNGHITLNYTGHFVDSPLNSYFIYIGYWTLNILLLLLPQVREGLS